MDTTSAPASANYVDLVLAGLAADPHRIAFYLPNEKCLRHGEFSGLIHRMAQVLADHGIQADSTVTLLSGNRAEVLAARYAANLLGARVVFLYEGLAVGTQVAIVSDVDTQLLLSG